MLILTCTGHWWESPLSMATVPILHLVTIAASGPPKEGQSGRKPWIITIGPRIRFGEKDSNYQNPAKKHSTFH